ASGQDQQPDDLAEVVVGACLPYTGKLLIIEYSIMGLRLLRHRGADGRVALDHALPHAPGEKRREHGTSTRRGDLAVRSGDGVEARGNLTALDGGDIELGQRLEIVT